MFNPLKEIPEGIKNWKENRDQLYYLLACVSAILVVAQYLAGARPSDSLSWAAQGIGADPIAKWLGPSAPPAIAASNTALADFLMSAVIVILVGMVVFPFFRTFGKDMDDFFYEVLKVAEAPATATIWVLLAVAAQYGSITPRLAQWVELGSAIVTWVLFSLVLVGAIYVLALIFDREPLARYFIAKPLNYAFRVALGSMVTIIAVLVAAVSVPLSIIFWMIGLTSDRHRKVVARN